MKKKRLVLTAAAMTILMSTAAFAGSWKQDSLGWWYQNDNGSYPASTWQQIDGSWYYFHSDGYMASDQWVGEYYVGRSGAMLTNTMTPDGWYVDDSGRQIGYFGSGVRYQKYSNGYLRQAFIDMMSDIFSPYEMSLMQFEEGYKDGEHFIMFYRSYTGARVKVDISLQNGSVYQQGIYHPVIGEIHETPEYVGCIDEYLLALSGR